MDVRIDEWLDRKGLLFLEHRRNGLLLAQLAVPNLITDAGRALWANIGIGQDTSPSHIALGTGTTAPAVGDTAMEAEVYREAAVLSRVTISVTNDGSQYLYTFTIDATYDISEAGLLNDAVAGILSCHQVFTALPCLASDTLKVTWRVRN